MLNGTQGDIIILRYKTQNRNRMTKSKTKQGMPEICMNCKFADTRDYPAWIMSTEIVCKLTKKEHGWEYSCKKWRIQE
jgi:hypothetical protein